MGKMTLGKIRKSFSQNTSCHGLPQMYVSTNKYQRIFWGLTTLDVFAILVAMLTIRIMEYNQNKTTTTFSEKYVEKMDFPAITICNFNNFFNIEEGEERDAIDELAKAKASGTPIDFEKIKYFDTVYNGSIREFAIEKGWQMDEDTLVYCFTEDDECLPHNFTYSITEIGKCWTYKNPPATRRAGTHHGISMVFNIHQDEYSENVGWGNWEAGVKVQIHSPHDVPEVDELGLAVPVGYMGFISVTKKEEKIMYEPWGGCQPDNEELHFYDTYSRPNCFKECFQNELEEYCECKMYYSENPSLTQECTPRETVDCLVNISYFARSYLTPTNCECQPPCHSTVYSSSISYAKLPNKAVEDDVNEGQVSDLAGINVYFERMSYTIQEESKAVTRTGLLSDLGGQLGLWIGISIVTLFEFIQFLLMYCYESIATKLRRKKGSQTSNAAQSTTNKSDTRLGFSQDNV
ncbi:bile acid-sensitive ion channel-like [Styela clava]